METLLSLTGGLVIGTVLGLLGGGGALMAIPVLIYVFHYPFRIAVGSSLALVALGVLPALILYWRNKQVDWLSALLMGGTGMFGAAVASRFSALVPKEWLLWLLIVLMALSAFNMLRGSHRTDETMAPTQQSNRWALMAAGLGIGTLTGLVGVGGGFLLVPALLIFGKLPVRLAIATSLVIIVLNALSGAMGYWSMLPITQPSFFWLMAGSLTGSVLGYWIGLKLPEKKLKNGFGLLLVLLIVLLIANPPA